MTMNLKPKTGQGFIRSGCLALLILMGLLRPAFAVDTNAAAGEISLQDLLRSSLQIQEQLHATQSAIETSRQEAAAALASNSLVQDERFRLMEKTAAAERLEQLNTVEHSERTILMVAGGLAALAFLVLLFALFLQWTAVNRLAATTAGLSVAAPAQGLGAGAAHLPPAHALEQSNTRFLGLIERLEQRIHELEATVKLPRVLSETNSTNGGANGSASESSPVRISAQAASNKADAINLLFSKSQTLLKLDQPEAALGCLDEVLTLDPGNADALVKKGAALERLQLIPQAIQCYDHAIARDNAMTMAYLYKGGLLNRLERHSEALACYEQALQLGKTAIPQASSSNETRSRAAKERRHFAEATSQNLVGLETQGNT